MGKLRALCPLLFATSTIINRFLLFCSFQFSFLEGTVCKVTHELVPSPSEFSLLYDMACALLLMFLLLHVSASNNITINQNPPFASFRFEAHGGDLPPLARV